ncbi:hypothetical protein PMAYCL1PPCAC_19126, partial [Pristionchus mayeri]
STMTYVGESTPSPPFLSSEWQNKNMVAYIFMCMGLVFVLLVLLIVIGTGFIGYNGFMRRFCRWLGECCCRPCRKKKPEDETEGCGDTTVGPVKVLPPPPPPGGLARPAN